MSPRIKAVEPPPSTLLPDLPPRRKPEQATRLLCPHCQAVLVECDGRYIYFRNGRQSLEANLPARVACVRCGRPTEIPAGSA